MLEYASLQTQPQYAYTRFLQLISIQSPVNSVYLVLVVLTPICGVDLELSTLGISTPAEHLYLIALRRRHHSSEPSIVPGVNT